jgi:hypothetical protein
MKYLFAMRYALSAMRFKLAFLFYLFGYALCALRFAK